MMTLFVKLFIKNKNEVSNPNVKKHMLPCQVLLASC